MNFRLHGTIPLSVSMIMVILMKLDLIHWCLSASHGADRQLPSAVSTPNQKKKIFERIDFLHELGARIIGGEFADPGEFPYYVQVITQLGDYFPSCGGALINESTVITAAHCVWDGNEPAKMISVQSKSRNHLLLNENPSFEWEIINGTHLIVHENYTIMEDGIPINDIAIIQLDRSRLPATLLPSQRGVKLASKHYPMGTPVVMTGLGLTESGRTPEFLKKKNSILIQVDKSSLTSSSSLDGILFTRRNDEDLVYIGDSGGPVIVKGSTADQDELIGIISFGDEYLEGNREGSTDVYLYRDWIQSKVGVLH